MAVEHRRASDVTREGTDMKTTLPAAIAALYAMTLPGWA
jgi:hypothetical protein